MARWEVRIPTSAPDGARGFQMFLYDLRNHSEALARSRALVDVTTPAALHHRRGATADTTALAITLRPTNPLWGPPDQSEPVPRHLTWRTLSPAPAAG
ncbi:hypothetical protein [Streptomyces sp. NPDC058773]|uniref:hypothetical protein n=1 Tax=Streptomyces sp. NPDC058773 TaxID=3346632 RepID=UPI00367B5152